METPMNGIASEEQGEPAQSEQAEPAAEEQGGIVDPSDTAPPGTVQQAIEGQDPEEATHVTVQEQAQYQDFVSRALLLMCDTRSPPPVQGEEEIPSPSATVMNMLNNPRLSVPQAIGKTCAEIFWIQTNAARRQKVEFSPDVIFHAADEIIPALYLMGNVRGLFKAFGRMTPEEAKQHEFTPQEEKMFEQAKIYGTHVFGTKLVNNGQITEEMQKDAQTFWKSQVKKEIENGEVSDNVFKHVDVQALRQEMARRMDSNKGEQQAPEAQAPPQQQAQPEQGAM